MSTTNLDPAGGAEWTIDDPVIALRNLATGRTYEMPRTDVPAILHVGRASNCVFQIHDPLGCVSRHHAELVHEDGEWMMRDLGSKNGIWEDGVRRAAIILSPGIEIGLGSQHVIVESARLLELRAFLARLIGWEPERRVAIDRAVRAVRRMATLRGRLLLCGEGDLVPVAHQLHRSALGEMRPFIVCDPKRRRSSAAAMQPANEPDLLAAIAAARGGTLCVWSHRLPRGLAGVVDDLPEAGMRVRLIVCASTIDDTMAAVSLPLRLTSLGRRESDLTRIVAEYASDAGAQLHATPPFVARRDLELLLRRRSGRRAGYAEIAKATLRLVAIRHFGGVTRAARHFGVSHVVLSRWLNGLKAEATS